MDEALNHRLGELLIELRDGNSLVLADIDALIGKRLRAYANIYYMQQPDVDDAVQSLLCKLYQASKSFRENKNAYSWIIKLFKNMIISQIRRVKREHDYIT